MQGNVRQLIAEDTETPFWYGRGKQVALSVAQGLELLHSRELVMSLLLEGLLVTVRCLTVCVCCIWIENVTCNLVRGDLGICNSRA